MSVTISSAPHEPVRITVDGDLDVRAASDVADLLDLTHPDPASVDLAGVGRMHADALHVLVLAARRSRRVGRRLGFESDRPHVDVLLAALGIAGPTPPSRAAAPVAA